jgi:hypothetical protein
MDQVSSVEGADLYSHNFRSAATNSLSLSNTRTRVCELSPRFKISRALRLASRSGFTITSDLKLSLFELILNRALACESIGGKEYPITDRGWRRQVGGDAIIAAHLARLLAEAPKSRSAEHLITSSDQHPSLEQERRVVSTSSIADNLAAVADKSNSLMHRALAAWCVSGIDWKREKKPGTDLPGLLDAYRNLGVPEELVVATGIAATKSREPITLMVPLIWLAAYDGQAPTVVEAAVPWSPVLDDIPMYALDKHTRIGLEAIRNLVKYNYEIRECLKRYVAPAQRHAAAYMAAFYADAAPLASKLSWDGADQLEALGTEADLLKVGVPREGVEPLLQLFRANVDHLNKLRAHTICKKLGLVDVATILAADEEG